MLFLLHRRGTFTDEDSIQLYKPDGLVHTLDMGDEDEESVCPRWCPAVWTRYIQRCYNFLAQPFAAVL